MTGPNWPNSGEIDIIEGVNTGSQNQMTMHTSNGCTLAGNNCQGNVGCPVTGGGSSSYGNGFNSANGGTYAMEWTSSQISIWFFSRGSEPGDINSANPNPSNWGNPTGSFTGGSGCDIDSHFMNNNIVFDTTFCGDWAGNVWSQDSTCSALAPTCQAYVQNNPDAFQDAYWAVNYLKVYTQGSAVSGVASVTPSSSSSSVPIAQPTSSPITSTAATSSAAPFTVSISKSIPSASPFPSGNATSSAAPSTASISKSIPSVPFPTGNTTSIAQPTASGAPVPSSNSSASFNTANPQAPQPIVSGSSSTGSANLPIGGPATGDNSAPTPSTAVSPPETPGPVATSTVTGNYVVTETAQATEHRHFGHTYPPSFGPKSKRTSRVTRHLQQHAHGAHKHS